ncbi:TetR/AcrR family transcriptional regulator [Actinophytocola algeriensis]|uniref:AcrR family transcriptional regulator n=1 Tax=Actinophytocola algeriensis TaxID=1768010 RepID=A0A7W7VED2_9PSEU|nr:TetR family transcriptional regulator [Actinophytocola algeriensis]MBB4906885.1 AcrR family transcriptional regulator [Actinophytocola algeriensis]MBE1478366.1 AcrR family transcriptional regulator [Actinophytocola algeriensis]
MADSPAAVVRTPKSEATRTLIVETALRLFQENGYDKTTMRAIAKEAGVSVGNAYYYFSSKEQLVQGFYDRITQLHDEACADVLTSEKDFAKRLRAVLLAWLSVAAPYHEFGRQFFVNAADPDSPLSPFSTESSPARDAQIALFRRVLEGSTAKVDPDLRPELPELLWLYEMGVVLFWVHDRSPDCRRTRMLVDRTVPLLDRVIGLSRLRLLRPVTREIVQLIGDLTRPEA